MRLPASGSGGAAGASSSPLLVVVRADSGDGVPRRLLRAYFSLRSLDGGKSWSSPKPMVATDGSPMGSARPRLLMLGSKGRLGPLVLTGGRPGLYLWVNPAGDGIAWDSINLAAAHNAALNSSSASLRFCDAFVNASLETQDLRQGICTLSMSYNSLVQVADCEAMVVYSRAGKTFAPPLEACGAKTSAIFALRLAASVGAGCSPRTRPL